jgi:hypothetical protein
MTRRLLITCCLVAGLLAAPAAARAEQPAGRLKEIGPLLKTHCAECHGGVVKEGGVDLTQFTGDRSVLENKKLWRRVLEQLQAKSMPPAEELPLEDAARAKLIAWTDATIATPLALDTEHPEPGRTVIRRLTRTEYNNTLRDLLGVQTDVAAAAGMPDETVGHGFDNLAAALKVQAVLMEKYFAAADEAISQLFTPVADNPAREAARVAAYEKLFFVRPGGEVTKRQAARQIMHRFLARAYRRPVEGVEVERFLKLYDDAGSSLKPLDDGVRVMLKGALVSPYFLLRVEENRGPEKSTEPYAISDYELASRLSHFVWASMPDDRLFELAAAGKLKEPETLHAEVTRMLADNKARALADNFAAQWLQLRKLPAARPSTEFFPELTPALRQAMYEETALLFDSLRTENRSLLTLLSANYTFLNQPLAEHYGIEGVQGDEFRRVTLKPDDVRGGVLSMASILTINAHTFRSSPTMRGKWILEVVFGTPPPPPPANVSQIKDEQEGGKEARSFRESLALHAKDVTCAACHKKIDPLGFGLETFDAIGRYRETHGGQPIDASGTLPGGKRFTGPRELKQVVLAQREDFVRHVAEQMYAYALGREVEAYDQAALEAIFMKLEKDDYRLPTLVHGIVDSYAFGHRRNLTEDEQKRSQ